MSEKWLPIIGVIGLIAILSGCRYEPPANPFGRMDAGPTDDVEVVDASMDEVGVTDPDAGVDALDDGSEATDAASRDQDDDGVIDAEDNCPTVANPQQDDFNDDGTGDACGDVDKDGVIDRADNCPESANKGQEDIDEDELGDACDPDIDGDGAENEKDCKPKNAAIHPGAVERCDMVDDDCDGRLMDVVPKEGADPLIAPVAYWPFQAYKNGELPDASTNKDVPPAVPDDPSDRPSLGMGVVGNAVDLEGDEYLKIAHEKVFELDKGTVMFWFRADKDYGLHGLVSKDSSGLDEGGHMSIYYDGYIRWRQQSDKSERIVYSEYDRRTDWVHVAASFDGKRIKLYVDGERVDEADFDVELWSKDNKNTEPWSIGALSWSSDDGKAEPASDELDGRIDELMVFDESIKPDAYLAACGPGGASN